MTSFARNLSVRRVRRGRVLAGLTGAVFFAALVGAPAAHAQDFAPPVNYAVGAHPGSDNVSVLTAKAAGDNMSVLPAVAVNPTVTLGSSLNPSQFGDAVTFTATVSGSEGTPTGTVLFNDGLANLGTAPLDANGVAVFTTSSLSVGTHPIQAEYGGDGTYDPFASNTVNQVVNPVPLLTCANATPTIQGTPRADNNVGTPGNDRIFSLGGADTVDGAGGNDLICAGPGNDTVTGGLGDDRVEGGPGNDLISGNDNNDTLLGGSGRDNLSGNNGDDALFGEAGNDVLNGGAGANNDGGTGRNVCLSPTGGPGCNN